MNNNFETRDGVTLRRVVFRTPDGISLVGHLRLPAGATGARPAVLVATPGPAAVKDQSVAVNYAHGLARAGFVTLVFDPRNFGESGGGIRQHFDMDDRHRDMRVAVSYLRSLGEIVDPNSIGVLGVSAGGPVAVKLAGMDPRVRAFVSVCGGGFDAHIIRNAMGVEAYDAELTRLMDAYQRFDLTGEVDYLPVVTPDGKDAFLIGLPQHETEPWDYYGTDRGASPHWENSVTVLSYWTLRTVDLLSPADFVGKGAGLLIVGTDDVYTPPPMAQAVYDRLTGPKDLITMNGANHIDLYDNPQYVTPAVEAAIEWFGQYLQ